MSSRDVVERTFRVHLCTVVSTSGEKTEPLVRCPRVDETIDANACAACMRMRALEWAPNIGGEVRCLIGSAPELDRRADFAELAARARIHEILAPATTCVTPDVSLARVRAIFAEGRARAVPLVDDDGQLQGLVSRSDLVSAPADGTVRDVMTPVVHALPADAPIAYAIALLGFEDVGEVPIVRTDGSVVGMCHAVDVLRWVAGRLGYSASKP